MAITTQGLAPEARARVEGAIESTMRDGTEAGVCALLDVLMAEAVRAAGPGE
ncbi:hypothetical protein [Kitasatospora sp. NPDC005856]|uniref:hypothetical protein n=1 Tax=Kitasatospora sp. NPDC005856 TaxID=3154566 RepID=UPI0033D673B6